MSKLDIVKAVATHGADKITFKIPMRRVNVIGPIAYTSSSDPEGIVECRIDQNRYPVADNYKIELRALDGRYGSESFYICDLESLLIHHPLRFQMMVA